MVTRWDHGCLQKRRIRRMLSGNAQNGTFCGPPRIKNLDRQNSVLKWSSRSTLYWQSVTLCIVKESRCTWSRSYKLDATVGFGFPRCCRNRLHAGLCCRDRRRPALALLRWFDWKSLHFAEVYSCRLRVISQGWALVSALLKNACSLSDGLTNNGADCEHRCAWG